MKRILIYTICACLFIMATSCEHKELCLDHYVHAPKSNVKIAVSHYSQRWHYVHEGGTDWEQYPSWEESFGMGYNDLSPGVPTGLRLLVYNEDGSADMSNHEAMGGIAYMIPGEHSLLLFNNDTEYIVFDDMHSFATAAATTRTRTRSTYMGNSYTGTKDGELTVNSPDMLYGNYIESYVAERSVEPDVIDVTLHPLVFTYLVRYEFESGLEYVSAARGALAGMARSVYLNSGRTSAEEATILYDCTVEKFGTQAIVRSFGIPDFPNEQYATRQGPRRYALNLEVLLKNGKTKTFEFDITDQISVQPQGGVITVKGIVINEEEGKEGSSGFDVEVDGWGEYEDVILPM